MWEYLLLGVSITLIGLCLSAKWILRESWEQKKAELEELKTELDSMDEYTEELRTQKKIIEDLLNNEFRDYGALFNHKKNID